MMNNVIDIDKLTSFTDCRPQGWAGRIVSKPMTHDSEINYGLDQVRQYGLTRSGFDHNLIISTIDATGNWKHNL